MLRHTGDTLKENPSAGEQISVALFYKHFRHPIEWTYTVAGGTDLIYSFVNARGANNYGVEVDIRKNLDFMGMKNFSLSFVLPERNHQ